MLFSYDSDAKESQLTSTLFYKEMAGRMDVVDIAKVVRNIGQYQHSKFGASSHTIDMMGHIHADIFFQDHYMLNEVTVKITMKRNKILSV
jgi:hypothetical protein